MYIMPRGIYPHNPPSQETRNKTSKALKNRHLTDEHKKNLSLAKKGKKTGQVPWNKGRTGVYTEESLKKMSDHSKGKPKSPEHCKNISLATKGKKGHAPWNKGVPCTEERKRKLSNTTKGRPGKPCAEETKKKLSKLNMGALNPNFGKPKSEETKEKMSESQKGKRKHPLQKETCKKMSATRTGLKRTARACEGIKRGQIEYNVGGFWYGSVKYHDKKRIYCELWNRDLWDRIDICWGYKSVLSGKTKADNHNRALSRHHVYWQPKACCGWDEDTQGYYAWINIGSNRYPKWYKHYIKGDPNKFVLLTNSEHQKCSKDKLKWIKIFEDIIDKHGGKCYFTKEEMKSIENI